jgi:glycosyltransferase involved in cell wall biosynthesis
VDDGSTDNTKEIIERIQDSRILYLYQENKGVCTARNLGIAKSRGKYLCFIDSDDMALPSWLKHFKEKIDEHSVDIVFCDMLIQFKNGKEKIVEALYPFHPKKYDDNGLFQAGTFAVQKTFLDKIGFFDENIRFGEFTELGFRFRRYGFTKAYTCKVDFIYQIDDFGGGKNNLNKISSCLYILKKHPWYFKQFPHVKRLYFQNIAVSAARINDLNTAKKYFLKAYLIEPWKITTLLRLFLVVFPFTAKLKWK